MDFNEPHVAKYEYPIRDLPSAKEVVHYFIKKVKKQRATNRKSETYTEPESCLGHTIPSGLWGSVIMFQFGRPESRAVLQNTRGKKRRPLLKLKMFDVRTLVFLGCFFAERLGLFWRGVVMVEIIITKHQNSIRASCVCCIIIIGVWWL